MTDLNPTEKVARQNAIKKITNKLTPGIPTTAKSSEIVDRVTLSESSKAQAPSKVSASNTGDIRRDLVQKFKTVLANGSYEVKADEIADKIVQKIREQKDGIIF
jgi:flagellar biosynthesis anti-sigma factor FlgM